MRNRLLAFLRGTDDAIPADYVFGMFMLLGVILAMIADILA